MSVPLIALVVAISLALFEVATAPDGSMFTDADLFRLVFGYTAVFAFLIGIILAVPMLILGEYLPRPRLASLLVIGVLLGSAIAVLLADGDAESRNVSGMALMGLLSAVLWWRFVERHREEGQFGE